MESVNRMQTVPTQSKAAGVVQDEAVQVARWLRHLGAELSCAQGLSVPLEALLARWIGQVQPQHMFDGLRQLLEHGEAELELGVGGYLLALAPAGTAVPRTVDTGEFVVLAAAIAAVRARAKPLMDMVPRGRKH